jgi:hypothetical protein
MVPMKLRAFALAAVLASSVLAVDASCSPAFEKDAGALVVPAVRAGCVLLRMLTDDGGVDEVCATAEDLAPFVGEIALAHASNADAGAPEAAPLLAFTVAPSKRKAPRRRCVQWALVSDAGVNGGDGGR